MLSWSVALVVAGNFVVVVCELVLSVFSVIVVLFPEPVTVTTVVFVVVLTVLFVLRRSCPEGSEPTAALQLLWHARHASAGTPIGWQNPPSVSQRPPPHALVQQFFRHTIGDVPVE
jgi:hypothetical protein